MSITQPKNGMFRHFQGVRASISPTDEKAYRNRLPKMFDMPDEPKISVFIADYITVFPWPMTRYQEGAVLLKCAYQGDEYWHCLTMPVTKRVPMWGGRRIGYPKFIADEIFLRPQEGCWEGKATHGGRTLLHLNFSPGFERELSDSEAEYTKTESFFPGGSLNLVPPKRGPAAFTVKLDHKQEPHWNPLFGTVKVTVDPGEEISGLFDPGAEHMGMFNEFRGGINLCPERLG